MRAWLCVSVCVFERKGQRIRKREKEEREKESEREGE